jgi:predicted metal-dependent phosphotriesterase family hydrolase
MHRALLETGALAEYDQSFRWGDRPNGTLQLLEWMGEDDLLSGIVLGMDGARRGYYAVYGGKPGLGWLLDGFAAAMAARGVGQTEQRRLFVENPARWLTFVDRPGESAS